jgi:hypothetical protein
MIQAETYTITKTANELSNSDWISWHAVEQPVDQGVYTLTYGTEQYTAELVVTQVLEDYVIYRIKFIDRLTGLSQIIIKKESVILYEDPSTTPEWLIWTIFQKSTFFGVVTDI